MREIKFRAWDGKKMWLVTELEIAKGNTEFVEHYGTDVGYLIRGLDNKGNKFAGVMPDGDTVLVQYTGLKDKNGVEIYQSDIVSFTNSSGDVITRTCEWSEKQVGWRFDGFTYTQEFVNLNGVEVVGNKYEN
jgi:uncharacterized phage protein (TIGR01671 family)